MRPTFRIEHAAGELRQGYFRACTFAGGTLLRRAEYVGDITSTLTATVVARDVYRLTQRPLDLYLALGGGWWVWHAVTVDVRGDALTVKAIGQPVF